jgi:cystathionine beta-synthase
MGTGGTISGVGKFLKEKNPSIRVIGADPIGSLYFDYFKNKRLIKATTYVVQGIGEDILPGTMDFSVLDDILQVTDEECFVVARRLARMEGIFSGGSCGGCVSAALRLARTLKPGDFVVAFLPDTGMRYLSNVYSDAWMAEHGYSEKAVALTAADVVRAKKKRGPVRELVTVKPFQTVFHALKTMQAEDISQIPVCEDVVPIGTIAEDQILTLALHGKDLRKLVVREVMGPPLPRVPADAPIERLTRILSQQSSAVFVEQEDGHLDILTKYDLIGSVMSHADQAR